MNASEAAVEVLATFENGSNFATVVTSGISSFGGDNSEPDAPGGMNFSDGDVINTTATDDNHNGSDANPLRQFDFLNPMWNVGFSFSVVMGTLGNAIVLWIVLGKGFESIYATMQQKVRLDDFTLSFHRESTYSFFIFGSGRVDSKIPQLLLYGQSSGLSQNWIALCCKLLTLVQQKI